MDNRASPERIIAGAIVMVLLNAELSDGFEENDLDRPASDHLGAVSTHRDRVTAAWWQWQLGHDRWRRVAGRRCIDDLALDSVAVPVVVVCAATV